MHKRLLSISVILFCSIIAPFAESGGINSSSTTHSISKSSSSSVTGTSDAFDNSNSTDLRLVADTINGGCFGAHAIITYQLSLVSSSNQNLSMTHYSQTNYQGIGQGWSTLTNLEMWVNVTDSTGNRQLWFSSSPDNQIGSSSTTSDLGKVYPYTNSSVELVIGIQHDNSFASESDCIGILEIYEIWSEPAPVAPDINYSPNVFEFTKGNSIQSIQPNNIGDAATSWSISPELPTGLSFSTSTGVISGNPNQISPSDEYNITATNAQGSDSTTINITVNDQLPAINYNSQSVKYYDSVQISDLIPTNTGGYAISWSIDPILQNGLSFSSTTGVISGAPTSIQSPAIYVIEATNTGGTNTTELSIEIVGAPSISYASIDNTFTKSQTINSLFPQNLGGEATAWTITPQLPQGLQFDSLNGIISGTPSITTIERFYLINASNPAGYSEFTISIEVIDTPPEISYPQSEYTLGNNSAIVSISPTNIGGDVASWSISPSFTNGLTFNSQTGIISGTPTIIQDITKYNITATNPYGSDSFEIDISIGGAPSIHYDYNSFIFTVNQQIELISPTNVGSNATSWAIDYDLPQGMYFDTISGEISGTPNVLSENFDYNITASNQYGSDTFLISLEVIDSAPEFSYDYGSYTFNQGIEIGTISPISTGGEITSWSYDCILPNGIIFNSTNGEISGTPTALTSVECDIIGSNSGGFSNFSVSLEVIIAPPLLQLDTTVHVFIVGYSNNSIIVLNSGGAASSWELLDVLPSGLEFSNGVISGIPTGDSEVSSYQIKASNIAGDDSTNVILKVVQPSPIFEYDDLFDFTKGQTIEDLVPTIIQGHSTNWTITPDLPTGLMINPITGVISGTPAVELLPKSYIISASNSQGQFEQSISIEIKESEEITNINTGSGDDGQGETPDDDSEKEKSWIEQYYLFIVLLAILLSLLLIVKRKDGSETHIPPVYEVHHHKEVHHHHKKETKETLVIKEFKEIAQPKPIDILAQHINSNVVGKGILKDSQISDFDKDCKFEEGQYITMKIMAARAYPIKGNIAMTKKEAIRNFRECFLELVKGPASGASIYPSVGSFEPDDGSSPVEGDQSYCLDLKASVNELLKGNILTNYIQSIREFIHSICRNYLQTSVLFMVEPPGFGGMTNMLDTEEDGIVKEYKKISGNLYAYISMAELEKLVVDINKSNKNLKQQDSTVETHQ